MANNPFKTSNALGIVRDWDDFHSPDYLKADNSGNWTQNGAPAHPGPYLPINYRYVLKRWVNKRATVNDDEPLPNPDDLNAQIPKEEWEDGYNSGEKRPPWGYVKELVLMNLGTGAQVLFSGSNIRNRIAVTQLIDQITGKNFVFGRTASPVVELASAPFPTQRGMQRRGDFKVLDRWMDLGGGQVLPGPSAPKPLPAPTLAQELNDEIPDFSSEPAFEFEAAVEPAKPAVAPRPASKAKARR
jgi:hypothetical protein